MEKKGGVKEIYLQKKQIKNKNGPSFVHFNHISFAMKQNDRIKADK